MQYIIDILKIKDRYDNTHQYWHSVHNSLTNANTEYANLRSNLDIIAAALTSWESGNDRDASIKVVLGNYSLRNCTGGIPVAKLIKYGCRSITGDGTQGRLEANDWIDTDGCNKVMSTQPSPGFTLSARNAKDGSTQG